MGNWTKSPETTLPRARAHVALSNLLKKESLPSCWVPAPADGHTRRPGHSALHPCFAACAFPAGLPGWAGGAVPATPAPRWRARASSTPRCASQFSGSLQHPVLGPPTVLGRPCHPPRPPASLYGSMSACHDCWAEGLPAEPLGHGQACLRPRSLCSPSWVPGAWQEAMYVP